MIRNYCIALYTLVIAVTLLASASATTYKWSLTNPNKGQLNAYQVTSGVITVASIHLTTGCQTPFLVPERMKFFYDLKIRTAIGVSCTQVVRDELVSFYEIGKASNVHVKTTDGAVSVAVHLPPTTPPTP